MELCTRALCTGCSACVAGCPRGAVAMQEDVFGFRNPEMDPGRCTDCGGCAKVCPILAAAPVERSNSPDCLAAWSADPAVRSVSSSGGVSSVLAEAMFRRGGRVFAAAFDSDLKLRHREVMGALDLPVFRGSKYLQM